MQTSPSTHLTNHLGAHPSHYEPAAADDSLYHGLYHRVLVSRAALGAGIAVANGAVTMEFVFDGEHGWLDPDVMTRHLDNDVDRARFASIGTGGRLPRPRVTLDYARNLYNAPGVVQDHAAWSRMLVHLEELVDGLNDNWLVHLDGFTDLFELLLSSLCDGRHANHLPVQLQPKNGDPNCPASLAPAPMEYLFYRSTPYDHVVQAVEVSYPGAGRVVEVAVTTASREPSRGRIARSTAQWVLTVPATWLLADLVDTHAENLADADDCVPVVDWLNCLDPASLKAILATAPDEVLVVRDHLGSALGGTVSAASADLWTLYHSTFA